MNLDNSSADIQENLDEILDYLGEASVLTLMAEALQTIPETINNLENASASKNWKSIKDLTHKIKGSFNIYGTKRLARLISLIEKEAGLTPKAEVLAEEVRDELSLIIEIIAEKRDILSKQADSNS